MSRRSGRQLVSSGGPQLSTPCQQWRDTVFRRKPTGHPPSRRPSICPPPPPRADPQVLYKGNGESKGFGSRTTRFELPKRQDILKQL